MAFDPARPANGAPVLAAELREQFMSLLALIQSIPVGPQGPAGPVGPAFTSFVVDSTQTLGPGEAAFVNTLFDGTNVRLYFGIPAGMPGTPFTNFAVAGTYTLGPEQPASVQTSFDGTTVSFTFNIPQGATGASGASGVVTQEQLDATATALITPAIASTAVNPIMLSPMNVSISDPPTQSEVQQIANKLDELIGALRRE